MLAFALALAVCAADAPYAGPKPLEEARRLADQLRYEEAVVEYQRYLALEDRPATERAQALFELGFIYLVLGDEANAHARGEQALELDPKLSLPPSAPARQRELLAALQQAARTKAKLATVPAHADDPPATVRARLKDPQGKVKRVLLRHALAANGPFHSVTLECAAEECAGQIPPPLDVQAFTAWYFVEALDDGAHTLATSGSASTPLQLSVVGRRAWYQSPVTWGVAGAALIVVAAVIYLLSPPPPK